MERFGTVLLRAARAARLVLITSALCLIGASEGYASCTAATTHTITTTSCGIVLSTPGCYNLTANLTESSSTGDCIEITAANVFLNLSYYTLTGTGAGSTGNGIHVTSTGAGAMISGGTISGFDIGFLLDGRTVLEDPTVQYNNSDGIQINSATLSKVVGGSSNNNEGNGLTINSSNSYIVSGFNADYNTGSGIVVNTSNAGFITDATANSNLSGIILNKSNTTTIPGLTALSNSDYGVELLSSSTNKIFATAVNFNDIYGVYFKGSSSNVLGAPNGGYVHCNGVVNVYLGCSDKTGPLDATCATPSTANEMDDLNVFGTAGTPYGIAIDRGDISNKVVGGSASTDTVDDMYDANLAGQNIWFANVFTTANQSYIH